MLLKNAGIMNVDQEMLVKAAGIEEKILNDGMDVEEMRRALKKLGLEVKLQFKIGATIEELAKLVNQKQIPAAVAWQMIDETSKPGDDSGHYSVVTHVDLGAKKIYLADPDRGYAGRDREIDLAEFKKRWWDEDRGVEYPQLMIWYSKI